MAKKALVLVSGGIDSTVSLWWAKKRGWKVSGLSFNYYRRSRREIAAAERIAEAAKCEQNIVVNLPFLREFSHITSPSQHLASLRGNISHTYIPGRNMVYYSIAAHLAEVSGAERIIGGHTKEDQSIFPDARSVFFKTLNVLLKLSLASWKHSRIKVEAPLLGFTKPEVLRLGLDLGAPIELTWSCYRGGQKPCGVCPACRARLEAFKAIGLEDPVKYKSS